MLKKIEKFNLIDEHYYDDYCYTSFIPTLQCNVNCNYCSMECYNYNPLTDYRCNTFEFQKMINFLNMQDYKKHMFEFFGGEPTLHPQLKEFTWMLDKQLKGLDYIHILTNLKLPSIYYFDNWPQSVKFSCSYHSHWMDEFDKKSWFKKVKELNTLGMIRDVKLIMIPGNEEDILDKHEQYKHINFPIFEIVLDIRNLDNEWGKKWKEKLENCDYHGAYDSSFDGEILYKDGTKGTLENYYKLNFFGMLCNAKFRIASNGNVYYCWARCWDKDEKQTINVFKDKLKKVATWHMCNYKQCWGCDMPYPKYSAKYFVEHRNEIQR